MRFFPLVLAIVALSGCGSVPQHVCPLVVPWSADDQKALSRALDADKDPLIHRAVQEDAGFRAWARGCQGAQ
ncbi:hypothetical protein Gbth_017_163 [Gluconobacter thailandicus F149-1 = NBRC 100600]|uniref:Lipoprotein n=1 Tax=Gluconobacter thailandicus NBRC 3257 TaxID=1381097 RepID=A0ABQ0IW57_GLUTH|nr:hypothetical protein [Gluconobacter thailandicus]KXV54158.1 hypothetical protein AD946_04290 [Gluconobacter thailandicus]GAD26451.1 hypothetical protein NBRC3257_1450 [Gluconobacter thailandicus NBRC 3257]GAN92988.1 hypothetical protein Gbth_017_163 [Gluconobacter thailandicus F149-1 = NBRC 100600]GBR61600.1 hypothetical protein AA100600_2938 [Gluconobacter thailandicus F149-1 = NBRC 100600]GEL87463.1 hypothetical protein GTH01_18210 [Gluconobacter thailandicus F149-1 = NBRC 100600]